MLREPKKESLVSANTELLLFLREPSHFPTKALVSKSSASVSVGFELDWAMFKADIRPLLDTCPAKAGIGHLHSLRESKAQPYSHRSANATNTSTESVYSLHLHSEK
ncbi:hypothetical protein SRHO_G00070260 [Serrasalmus rhombeus]